MSAYRGALRALASLAGRCPGEEGQGLAEYGLILAFVVVVSVASLTLVGLALMGMVGDVAAAL